LLQFVLPLFALRKFAALSLASIASRSPEGAIAARGGLGGVLSKKRTISAEQPWDQAQPS
jgi:hypothetical protein